MNNLLTLHEAIVIALLSDDQRTLNFDGIAKYIDKRGLYPNRKGGISLAKQVMLRSTKSTKRYHYLFEQIDEQTIRLRNIV